MGVLDSAELCPAWHGVLQLCATHPVWLAGWFVADEVIQELG
jgi:hypothetical protein